MALIGEADGRRYLGKRAIELRQRAPSLGHAAAAEVVADGAAVAAAEDGREVHWVDPGSGGEIPKRARRRVVAIEEIRGIGQPAGAATPLGGLEPAERRDDLGSEGFDGQRVSP